MGTMAPAKGTNDVPTLAAALEEAAIASKMPTPRHEVRAPMQQMVQRPRLLRTISRPASECPSMP